MIVDKMLATAHKAMSCAFSQTIIVLTQCYCSQDKKVVMSSRRHGVVAQTIWLFDYYTGATHMSEEDTDDLIKFLKPFPDEVKGIALWLREFVWELYPEANELIYDNYNAVAFG